MLFTQSLKKNFQFRYVYHKGRSFANRRLVMYIIKNGTAENRLGISVSKKSRQECCPLPCDPPDPGKLPQYGSRAQAWL